MKHLYNIALILKVIFTAPRITAADLLEENNDLVNNAIVPDSII